ncbi:hypothetical protein BLOT_004532 [Blomia tropicalis]|nr:hypothetical protein BLOT_004532 [Blomia tropicalis]
MSGIITYNRWDEHVNRHCHGDRKFPDSLLLLQLVCICSTAHQLMTALFCYYTLQTFLFEHMANSAN